MLRFLLVFWFILYCVRYRALPWNFFQLNADYFNDEKGIFSKLEMDRLIPKQWRLRQFYEDGQCVPHRFPVFVKPEWGQNSHGIRRADSKDDFVKIRARVRRKKMAYIVQEAAREALEFEVFYIRSPDDAEQAELLSITEVVNTGTELFPINGIHDRFTRYHERTDLFGRDERDVLWRLLRNIGHFRLARVGLRADSKEDLLAGNFHIIEINLFLPMPLSLLDESVPWSHRVSLLRRCMAAAAKAVKVTPRRQRRANIFLRKIAVHYQVKLS